MFVNRMLTGRQPIIHGSGEQSRDFLYVGDVARANLRAVDQGDGGMYNLGNGVSTSINTIYTLLAELTGYTGSPQRVPAKQGEVFAIALDASLAARELGWSPQTDLRRGLHESVDYFRHA
jgi:UDP-glucose 4-epimerase